MVLLHVLHTLSARHGWKLTVAHFNHQLRGRSSDADERLVVKTAATMRLPVVAERADVRSFAEKSRLSTEMAGRKLRHEFFSRAARKRGIRTVALAHHADDQVELFFLRLLRGAGGEGLAGMKWHSPSPVDSKIVLVRPLLDADKVELREFARENKIRFREDATNALPAASRNRIRNELLPLLREKYQPALAKTVLRLMEIIGAEADVVGEAAQSWLQETGGDMVLRRPQTARRVVPAFVNLPVAIQRRVLQLQLARLGVPADFELIESLRRPSDVSVSVGAEFSVSRDAAGSVKLRAQPPVTFNASELVVKLSGRAGEVNYNGIRLVWRLKRGKRISRPHGRGAREFFDADGVGEQITLRHWRPGDRFQPIGLKAAAKLQDLFTNAKIPRVLRRRLIVAEAAGGEIFWVEGLRIGENFKLTPRTRRQLVWRWRAI